MGAVLIALPFAESKRDSSTASRARQKAAGSPRTRDFAQNDVVTFLVEIKVVPSAR